MANKLPRFRDFDPKNIIIESCGGGGSVSIGSCGGVTSCGGGDYGCGGPRTEYCSECGVEIIPGSKYCHNCGLVLR